MPRDGTPETCRGRSQELCWLLSISACLWEIYQRSGGKIPEGLKGTASGVPRGQETVPVPNRHSNKHKSEGINSVQFSSVAQSCPTLCDPMNRSTPGLSVHHQLPEFTHTHVHRVGDAIQPSHPLSSPSPPAPNPSQHQSLFQGVNSLHEVAKVLEFQCKC